MNYLIDTNICIHFFRGNFNLDTKFEAVGFSSCAISEVTLAELVFGAENSTNPTKNYQLIDLFVDRMTVLPIVGAVYHYAKEKVRLRALGKMISDFDLLIGCTALERGLVMVTENMREFERIRNITLENWINR